MFNMRRSHFRHARWFCSHESMMDRILCWENYAHGRAKHQSEVHGRTLTQNVPTAGSETCIIYWFFASFHAPQLRSSDAR